MRVCSWALGEHFLCINGHPRRKQMLWFFPRTPRTTDSAWLGEPSLLKTRLLSLQDTVRPNSCMPHTVHNNGTAQCLESQSEISRKAWRRRGGGGGGWWGLRITHAISHRPLILYPGQSDTPGFRRPGYVHSSNDTGCYCSHHICVTTPNRLEATEIPGLGVNEGRGLFSWCPAFSSKQSGSF